MSLAVTNDAVNLSITGGITTVGDELIDRRLLADEAKEKPTKLEIRGTTRLVVGRAGVKVWIVQKNVSLKIPRDVRINQHVLADVGISCSFDMCTGTTLLISNADNVRSSSVLESLLRKIPILRQTFLTDLIESLPLLEQDFEASFPKYDHYLLDPGFAPNEKRTSLFTNWLFAFIDPTQFGFLEPVLNIAKAESVLCPSASLNEITNLVGEKGYQPNFSALVKPAKMSTTIETLLSEAASQLNCFLISTDDIFESVKLLDVAKLRHIPKRRALPSVDTPISKAPPAKRRRGNRVKALDSLDFFAGGEPTTQPHEPGSIPQSQATETQPGDRKPRSRIRKLGNMMLDTFTPTPPSLDHVVEVPGSDNEVMEVEANSYKSLIDIDVDTTTGGSGSAEHAGSIAVNLPAKSKRPLESQSFSTAVIEAKRRADERFSESAPIDEDAVEHLRDLAIIEEIPVRVRDHTEEGNSQRPAAWEGRRNFKVFVKNTKGPNNTNLSCLKEYIQFQVYDPQRDAKMAKLDESMLNAVELGKIASLRMADSEPNKLFVDDDEDDDDDDDDEGFQFTEGLGMDVRVASEEHTPEYRKQYNTSRAFRMDTTRDVPSRARSRPVSRLAAPAADDDDSEDEARFQFK